MKKLLLLVGLVLFVAAGLALAGCTSGGGGGGMTEEEITYADYLAGSVTDINTKYIIKDTIKEVNETMSNDDYAWVIFESSDTGGMFGKPFDFVAGDTIQWEYYWDGSQWVGYDWDNSYWDTTGVTKV